MICDPYDVVVVPFPFTDQTKTKRRPALIISQKIFNQNGHSIAAMITTKSHSFWPGDTPLQEPSLAGLHVPCMVRFKLFTLDNRLILKKIGHLSTHDKKQTSFQLHHCLAQ